MARQTKFITTVCVKVRIKISKTTKFGDEMLQYDEYIFSRAYLYIFESACNNHFGARRGYKTGYIFRILWHFVTKLCSFANFNMIFLGTIDFAVLAKIKFSLQLESSIGWQVG